jgi:hypothetical protein
VTRAQWLHRVERDGVRLSVSPAGAIRVRGRLPAADRARLREDHSGISRLIKERARKAASVTQDAPQPEPEPTHEPEPQPGRIVGEAIVGWCDGRLAKRPIYARAGDDVPHDLDGRRWLAEAVDESHGWQPSPGLHDVALTLRAVEAQPSMPEPAPLALSPRRWPRRRGRTRLAW